MIPLPEILPVFPLSGVVLFPETLVPLHIFEPRYRQMLADALDGDRQIGMILPRPSSPPGTPGREAGAAAEPRLYDVGCSGRIIQHKSLEGGRSMIVLQGSVRFRVREEVPGESLYRRVRTQALYEPTVPPEEVRSWRPLLREAVGNLAAATGGEKESATTAFDGLEDRSLVNYLCATLPLADVEKQALLECGTESARFRRLLELVEFLLAEARAGGTGGGTAH